jgi:isoquinoline 1-oxidoreductase alpha subunit
MELLINNRKYTVDASPDDSLLNVLRDDLDLTGTKYGCGEGACGACKVLVDDVATPSCVTRIGSLAGRKITTIEAIGENGKLNAVQRACLTVDVFQCAYCASGMIVAATALLTKNPRPSEQEIVHSMQGNICRCGTYPRMVKAIAKAANS